MILCCLFLLGIFSAKEVSACSTFKLQKGEKLVYGHNLNEGDIGVPGMIFLNKRGIFKMGRTWSELTTKDRENPSSYSWISRYGSITFNNFGRDLPDGGMNEAGLFIWEMNEEAGYPKNDTLPKLCQMNWMQYILDNYSTTTEAIQCASEIEIDGWGWHFFIGDATGEAAAVAFIKGDVVVYTGDDMPVPGLFNSPYKRELELLRYYRDFGGLYEPVLDDPKVPRFVKTAVMIDDYKMSDDVVDYGFYMLDNIMVNDVPEWSILFDAREQRVYFKTRINPEIKSVSMNDIDFSNENPVLILNMDIKEGGDVLDQFHPYSTEEFQQFTEMYIFPIIPEEFFTMGGITSEEYLERLSTHCDAAVLAEYQIFTGVWGNTPGSEDDEMEIIAKLSTNGDAVSGIISLSGNLAECYPIEHIQMIANKMTFTFRTKSKSLIEVRGLIADGTMEINLYGIEDYYGSYLLVKN